LRRRASAWWPDFGASLFGQWSFAWAISPMTRLGQPSLPSRSLQSILRRIEFIGHRSIESDTTHLKAILSQRLSPPLMLLQLLATCILAESPFPGHGLPCFVPPLFWRPGPDLLNAFCPPPQYVSLFLSGRLTHCPPCLVTTTPCCFERQFTPVPCSPRRRSHRPCRHDVDEAPAKTRARSDC